MGAAWEAKPPLMVVGIPNTNLVTINWAFELKAMWFPPDTNVHGTSGLPIDVARNSCVKYARKNGAKYLLFLDSDVVPARRDWIRGLLEMQQPIVSGLYWSKKGHPGIWRLHEGSYAPITGFTPGAIVDVDAVGAGALLIDMRVFDELDKLGKKPYFVWEIDDLENIEHKKGEDFHFCRLAKEAGFNIFVNTSIEMYHEQNIAWGGDGRVARLGD